MGIIIKLFDNYEAQKPSFYSIMGKFFADRSIIKEMDCQLYNNNCYWIIAFNELYDVLGFVSIEAKKSYLYIDNFYVLKEFRDKNIGNRLIKTLVHIFSEDELRLITANQQAEHIFINNGFEVYGANGKYKKMRKKPKLIMK